MVPYTGSCPRAPFPGTPLRLEPPVVLCLPAPGPEHPFPVGPAQVPVQIAVSHDRSPPASPEPPPGRSGTSGSCTSSRRAHPTPAGTCTSRSSGSAPASTTTTLRQTLDAVFGARSATGGPGTVPKKSPPYSRSPAASRASWRVENDRPRTIFPSRTVKIVSNGLPISGPPRRARVVTRARARTSSP